MTNSTEPPILPGCSVLPPMEVPHVGGNDPWVAVGNRKPKKTPDRRRSRERFAMLNTFLDFTARELSKNEILAWLLLYRDTKPDGTARTSQADLARRAAFSDRSIRRAIVSLQRLRLLTVWHHGGIGRGPSIYVVRALPPDR